MTTTATELTTVAQFTDSNRIITAVSFAILYYDFVLTIPQEVELYWKRRLSWGSALFFLNRYSSVLCHIPIIYKYYWDVSPTSCDQLQFYHGVLATISQGIVALLLIVRTYALYDCNRRVAIGLSTILVIGGVVSIWAICQTRQDAYDPSGGVNMHYTRCILVVSRAQGQHYAIVWSAVLVFDAAVFTLTLTRALRLGLAWRGGLFYVILRDGTMYFGILIVCYLTNAITFAYGKPGYQGFLATFTNALAATLVTRMMLNIRDTSRSTDISRSSHSPRSPGARYPLRFERIHCSMSASSGSDTELATRIG